MERRLQARLEGESPCAPLSREKTPWQAATDAARQRPLRGLFLYGFGYGLASTGCTLPIYVGLVVFPLSSGAFGRAFIAFVSFAAAMGGLMMLLTACIGLSKRTPLQHLIASTALIRKVSGAVPSLIGLYVGYYFLRAGM